MVWSPRKHLVRGPPGQRAPSYFDIRILQVPGACRKVTGGMGVAAQKRCCPMRCLRPRDDLPRRIHSPVADGRRTASMTHTGPHPSSSLALGGLARSARRRGRLKKAPLPRDLSCSAKLCATILRGSKSPLPAHSIPHSPTPVPVGIRGGGGIRGNSGRIRGEFGGHSTDIP
jgi:hypothetical protein